MITETVTLHPAELAEFYSWAAALGHDRESLAAGEEVLRYLEIPTVEAARGLLSHSTREQRVARQKTFFQPAIALRKRLGQGLHDRGEAFAFADGVLDEADAHSLSVHLPLHVKSISILQKTVLPGEVWDVSVRGDIWGFDEMEELYTAVNVGTLVLEPGSRLVVRGNVFALLCQQVIARGDARIGILPTPFSVDYGAGPMDGSAGVPGLDGEPGAHGRSLRTGSSILGRVLVERIEPKELHGGHGQDGLPGARGRDGRNGGMCKLAELTVRNVHGLLTIYACAGQGGYGGNGGDGGSGGCGGDGADGHRVLGGIFPGGHGGNGGKGGDGGRGGHGGSGGLSSNIYVNVPAQDRKKIIRIALPSQPGAGGVGGRAGKVGTGGRAGSGPALELKGVPGNAGGEGRPGKSGAAGRSRPAPRIFLNEEL